MARACTKVSADSADRRSTERVVRTHVSYVIQAFVVAGDANLSLPFARLALGYVLHPLNERLRASLGIPFCPLTDDGAQPAAVPEALSTAGLRCSTSRRVAYIEAEDFGGPGSQASIVWDHGTTIRQLEVAAHGPINAALRLLGVRPAGTDEFDAVGLGRYRHTDEWPLEDGPTPVA